MFPVYGGKVFCFLCLLTVTNCLVGLRARRTPHLLLLLCSQLYHLGFTIVGEVFMYMTGLFFKPTIEVVTFHLCGWCVLGGFFLFVFWLGFFVVAGIHPSRICVCQDFSSPCDEMNVCAHTGPRFILSSERVWEGGMESEPI